MPVQTRKRTAALAESSHSQTVPETCSPSTSAPSSANTNTSGPAAKRQKNLPVGSKEDEAAAAASAPETIKKPVGNVVRFDDEGNADGELAVPATTTAAPAPVVTEDEAAASDDDDSDEAPEAVSTSRVAKEMMESAQAVKKLAQEQAAASKKKRQQRDALFKQQALERKEANPAVEDSLPASKGRKRAERLRVADVLPAEFLADSSSEDDDDDDEEDDEDGVAGAARRGRTVPSVEKRLARQARAPRDEVIGTTVYRIAGDVDARMAPKVKKQAQGAKHALLRRGRQPIKGGSAGFFKR
ncbi:hypothetical protein E4U41_001653 [Claviceps citrina]|nr:hypothetical protein E4U41_001653 [Claviceps citrina]